MKNISIKTNLSTVSSNNYFPIVIFGNNLLQAGYDVINNLVLSGGGGGTITLTKENIRAIDTTETTNVESVTGKKNINVYSSDDIAGNTALRYPSGIETKNVVGSVGSTKKEVYPYFESGTGTSNTEEFLNSSEESRQVPTQEINEHLTQDQREVISEISTTLTQTLDPTNLTQAITFMRFTGTTIPKQALADVTTDTKIVTTKVNTTIKEVVTDASISGAGGSSAYSDSIVYNYEGTEVTISGNGYKRLLSETSNKPIKVSLLRVQIIGATDSQIDDILSQKGYIVNAQGSEVMENIFYPAEFVNPDDYRKNILDIPLEIDCDGNTAIVLGGIQNSDIEIKCTFFYN